jgi:predicted DCC family thiol-disulfide oxidoreductase YuxK
MQNGSNDYKLKIKPVIFFDGVCDLCNGFARFILKRDRQKIFRFGLLQSQRANKILKSRGLSGISVATVVLLEKDRIFVESDAVLEIMKRLNREGWHLLYRLKIVPKFMRDFIYRIISRNRYRIFGRRKTCMIPPDDLKDRFVS